MPLPKQAAYDVLRPLKPDEWSKDHRWIFNRILFLACLCERKPLVYIGFDPDTYKGTAQEWYETVYKASYNNEETLLATAYPRLATEARHVWSWKAVRGRIPYKDM